MIIPKYWAEHQIEQDFKQTITTIRRFGWSDTSKEQAEQNAIQRCNEARQTLLSTGKIKRIEGRESYLDKSGLPIREQVVNDYQENGCITTINSYGAVCLNVADVMILDVDDASILDKIAVQFTNSKETSLPTSIKIAYLATVIIPILSAILYITQSTNGMDIAIFFIATIFTLCIPLSAIIFHKNKQRSFLANKVKEQGGLLSILEHAIATHCPQFSFNLYRTPNGYRLIALQDLFSTNNHATQLCFDRLPVDKKYANFCHIQNCYRARVTGKPWRMKIKNRPFKQFWHTQDSFIKATAQHRKSITYPFQLRNKQTITQRLQQREDWLANYHQVASNYRACKFIKRLGDKTHDVHPKVAQVIKLHDSLCQCETSYPLA